MNTGNADAQFNKMTKTPVPRLIISLAIPTIISMLISSLYNMADTAFVSQLGTSAAGAVGISFSLMAIIQAAGFLLGMGAGSLISRSLGQKNVVRANKIAATAFFAAIFFGSLVTVFGIIFLSPLMRALGATETILPYARDYARYILFGAPIMCSSFVLNNMLRSQGRAALAMVGITTGGLLNIALDPIFIFTLGLGISGAAIATLISQCISFSILLGFFLRRRTSVHLSVKNISIKDGTLADIVKTGFPSFCRQGLASIATVALNVNASFYGDAAVAAFSIVGRFFFLVLSIMLGFGQGFQPVAGYNYGAKRYDRVKWAFRFSLIAGTIALTTLSILGFIFAPDILRLFRRDDPEVIAIGALACRMQCLVLPLQPLMVVSNMLFQVTGHAGKATFISSCRQGIFFLPLIAILPRFLGLQGIQLTQPLSDLLTAACCIPILIIYFASLSKMSKDTGETL